MSGLDERWEAVPSETGYKGGLPGHKIRVVPTARRPYGFVIADTDRREPLIGPEEDRANSLILAAGPELADALEGLLRVAKTLIPGYDGEGQRAINKAGAALAKAGRGVRP